MIELISVYKKYPQKKKGQGGFALLDINLEISEGDTFGIIGLSGAGKTTLLRALATLEAPSQGKIYFEGQEIFTLSVGELRKVRRQIGVVFQQFHLFPAKTVKKNIAYPLEIEGVSSQEIELRVLELLELVGLEEKGDLYPSVLSGGEKQRVAIARALASRPKVLLCDEPTSALDPKTTREMVSLLRKIKQTLNVTVIIITHDMALIKQLCNQVAVLDKGEIVERGSLAEIFVYPKHEMTKKMVQQLIHEIPPHFYKEVKEKGGRLLHLHFRGERADKPIISEMVKSSGVDANILLGWIDSLQAETVGNLVISLTGEKTAVAQAMAFLREKEVRIEEL